MNLDESIERHAEWKTRLRGAIARQETLDAARIARHDACELGQWLKGAGRAQHGGCEEFRRVCEQHQAFHVEAGPVAELINAGRLQEAESQLAAGSDYSRQSTAVATALRALRRRTG